MNGSNVNSAERANPVIDTARLTVSQLAAAEVPEAVDLAGLFGFQDFMKNYQVTGDTIHPLAIIQEARYSFLNRSIEQTDIPNILDLGCGFSPRGLVMARKGRQYLGCDLESAVNAMSEIARKVSGSESLPGEFSYHLTDITDPSAVLAAAAPMNGKIILCCEGVLIYLGIYEFDSLLSGISAVLHEHGGFFLTPDLVSAKFMTGILTALLGEEEGMKALYAMAHSIAERSDTQFKGTLTGMPKEQMQKLFEKHDLTCEFVPFFPADAALRSFDALTEEQIARIRKNLSGIQCLKLTAARHAARSCSAFSDQFSFDITRDGGSLFIRVTGRLDSVSAPVLLDAYTAACADGNVAAIRMDASKLDYISSAGLRTLLIMQKQMKEGKIRVQGVQEAVGEILHQTGFDDILALD